MSRIYVLRGIVRAPFVYELAFHPAALLLVAMEAFD